jgi:hypothetical protein
VAKARAVASHVCPSFLDGRRNFSSIPGMARDMERAVREMASSNSRKASSATFFCAVFSLTACACMACAAASLSMFLMDVSTAT